MNAPITAMRPGHRVDLLHDGVECLPAILAEIAGAEREILLEMYWFDSDATGRRFADALARRAREGIRVCVTYDALGSFEADRRMFDAMREAGCGVYEYNPVRFGEPRYGLGEIQRRNHRKMLVVDGRIAMTGGLNLADAWAPEQEGGQGFRDDMIRIEGPAVAEMREIFLGTYQGAHAQAARDAVLPPPMNAGPSRVRVLANDHRRLRREIRRAYLHRIDNARERVLLTNSYFVPRRIVRQSLARAVERGVAVRILLPTESDVPAVVYATHYLYDWLLDHGVEIYEWPHGILHAKTAVVDGSWCTVGTFNFDYLSWAVNLELNVAVDDPEVAARLEARVQRDLEVSPRLRLANWRFRPIGERLLEIAAYRMRRLL